MLGALVALVTAMAITPAVAGKSAKAVCGNGIAEGSEQCDVGDFHSQTCQSLGFVNGTLLCTAQCTLDTSGCSNARFTDNGDGTVTDNVTHLQWEKKGGSDGVKSYWDPHDVDNTYSWGDLGCTNFWGCPNGTAFNDFLGRLNYCVSDGTTTIAPGFAGHCDWRLPTLDELKGISDLSVPGCGAQACIDPIFGPTGAGIYATSMTSTLVPNSYYPGEFIVGVDFKTGSTTQTWKGAGGYGVRAVRGGF